MRYLCSLVLCFLLVQFSSAAQVRFVDKPSVTKNGERTKISFAVSASTDVEVAIVSDSGKIVRHLVAGVIGGDSVPVRPLVKGLKQELWWDGKTDAGKSVEAKDFKVRVRLGLGIEPDGFVGENRDYINALFGLATNDKGNLFVLSSSVRATGGGYIPELRVYDRDGKYLRALMPMPANLTKEKLIPLGVRDIPGEKIYPSDWCGVWPFLYKGLRLERGRQARFLDMPTRIGESGVVSMVADGAMLALLAPDGGSLKDEFSRLLWSEKPKRSQHPAGMVVSPDEKTLYIYGFCAGGATPRGFNPDKGEQPVRKIFKVALESGTLELFAELPEGSGSGSKEKRFAESGLAFDGKGNLLVCDRLANRIVVLDLSGNEVGSFPVDNPQSVVCNRKSGVVYVVTATPNKKVNLADKKLIKFSGWNDPEQISSFELPQIGQGVELTIDESGKTTVIWIGCGEVGSWSWYVAGEQWLWRLEDTGDEFVKSTPIDVIGDGMGPQMRLAVQPENDIILVRGAYATHAAYNGITGEQVETPFKHCLDMGVGLDGNWYIVQNNAWQGKVIRYAPDFSPIQGEPGENAGYEYGKWGAGLCGFGLSADHEGKLYAASLSNHQVGSGEVIVTFDLEGKAAAGPRMENSKEFQLQKKKIFNSCLVGPVQTALNGMQIDHAGNIYIGTRLFPKGYKFPAGFEDDIFYPQHCGSVVKFKPDGGAIYMIEGTFYKWARKVYTNSVPDDALWLERTAGWPKGKYYAENGVTAYHSLGGISGLPPKGFGGCSCRRAMFQVDGWGRLFIPNTVTYSVRVADNENNDIFTFGNYGNVDSRGNGDNIPLGWPEAVSVSEKAVYVADALNHRIVRLLKKYAAEESVSF